MTNNKDRPVRQRHQEGVGPLAIRAHNAANDAIKPLGDGSLADLAA
eukprot:CAMPEP_0170404478 /NCGR_PEP_ID=MMETSP0117_2-20130122/26657_1 /TAXON_ID=400756 /ORGANISM="Durinskia baltica, Strain CSIRO CS-38" /LENGTH=45 /DNA_ID= /DNA_START= /DNA_END= /DNA_ORIENTATION=